MIFEPKHMPLLPAHKFVLRLLKNFFWAILVFTLSLFGGMAGYHHFAGLSWVEAYENASMILSGMGPVKELHSDAAKIFAGSYALFSGIIFLIIIGIISAPIYHRFLHKFHLEDKE